MSKTSPRTFVKPQPAKTSDRAAVFALTKRGRGYRKVRVSGYMSYPEASEVYTRMEAYNVANVPPFEPFKVTTTPKGFRSTEGLHKHAALGAGGGPIVYLAVRSEADPHWNHAPRVTAVPRTREARAARAKVRAL